MTTASRVRSVLAEPRGHRFSRPATNRSLTAPPEPLIELWPHPPETHQARQERLLGQMEGNPRLAYRLQHHAVPHWTQTTHRNREQPQQPRDTITPSPQPPNTTTARGRHRAPRPWWAWPATAISTALLLGVAFSEVIGRSLFQPAGTSI